MAKFLDMEGLTYLWGQIKERLSNKVDKVDGKGLSTNDYTTEEKEKLGAIEENANNYVHPTSGVIASSYTKVTVDANGHVTSGNNPTTLEEYGIVNGANKEHTHISADIVSLDASKLTGKIDIERLPVGALERLVIVETDTERFELTVNEIQKGDTVKVINTNKMYFIVDDSKLSTEAGYVEYSAGNATAVDWSGVTNKPSTYTPSAHTHTQDQIIDFPTALKNPTSLTININGVATSYDGSEVKTVTIDEASLGISSITTGEIDTIIAS